MNTRLHAPRATINFKCYDNVYFQTQTEDQADVAGLTIVYNCLAVMAGRLVPREAGIAGRV